MNSISMLFWSFLCPSRDIISPPFFYSATSFPSSLLQRNTEPRFGSSHPIAASKKGRNSSKQIKQQKKKKSKNRNNNHKLPRLVIYDLDGCLWKPELFELLIQGDGPPFSKDPLDKIGGTCLKSNNGKLIELLGDTRRILQELYTDEKWYPTRVGISSRTDPPEWAWDLLEQFVLYDPTIALLSPSPSLCAMKDVFDRSICILDKNLDKSSQFQMLLEKANQFSSGKNLKYKDIIFFDNEAGNCKQVSKLGVTCVYTPKGLTYQAWENGLLNFPSNRVLGPKLPY